MTRIAEHAVVVGRRDEAGVGVVDPRTTDHSAVGARRHAAANLTGHLGVRGPPARECDRRAHDGRYCEWEALRDAVAHVRIASHAGGVPNPENRMPVSFQLGRRTGTAPSEYPHPVLGWDIAPARRPAPLPRGCYARVRAEHVSWLEAAVLAFPTRGSLRVSVADREHAGSAGGGARAPFHPPSLIQWRGRAGMTPDFRNPARDSIVTRRYWHRSAHASVRASAHLSTHVAACAATADSVP